MLFIEDHIIDSKGQILNQAGIATGLSIDRYDYVTIYYNGSEGMKVDRINSTIVDIQGNTLFNVTPFGKIVRPYKG